MTARRPVRIQPTPADIAGMFRAAADHADYVRASAALSEIPSAMMTDEDRQLYGGRKPKSYRPAHNHVIHTPGFGHGMNGFRRFWIPPQWVGRGWAKCPCGWMAHRPEWKTHYAHSEHVKWWKAEIKKRGSLEAVYRHVIKRLAADDHRRGFKRGMWDHVLEQMKPV